MTTRYILSTVALFFLALSSVQAEEIKVSGTNSSITKLFSPIKSAYESTTGDTLTLVTKSVAPETLISLEKGEVDMASINGLSFDDLIARASTAGVTINPATLRRTVVAQTNLLVLVNKSNKVASLSKEQLKAVFTGKVTNWRDVGGPDLAIQVYWGKETPYLNGPFTNWVLNGEKVTNQAKSAGDHFDLREIVLKDPAAIVLSSSGLVTPSTKAPAIPAMHLPMEVVTKGEPSAKVKKVLTFYKEEFGFMDE